MRKINRIERLARREEKNIIKRIFVLSAISVVLIIIVFTVGASALGKFADLLDIVFKDKSAGTKVDNSFVAAPILDPLPGATNSAQLAVSGFAADGKKVEIYIDGDKVGNTSVEGGRFNLDDITLSNGENQISAKAISDIGANSDFSQKIKVIFDKKEPDLSVSTPTDSQNFSGNNRVKVEGQTEKDAQVFANGFLANVDSGGKFEVTIPLTEGDNNIEVRAQDEAGNAKIVKLKVNFKK